MGVTSKKRLIGALKTAAMRILCNFLPTLKPAKT